MQYDIVGGRLADLVFDRGVEGASCLVDSGPPTTWDDPRSDPGDGHGYYYLVRAQNICGSGTYGFSTSYGERQPAAACP